MGTVALSTSAFARCGFVGRRCMGRASATSRSKACSAIRRPLPLPARAPLARAVHDRASRLRTLRALSRSLCWERSGAGERCVCAAHLTWGHAPRSGRGVCEEAWSLSVEKCHIDASDGWHMPMLIDLFIAPSLASSDLARSSVIASLRLVGLLCAAPSPALRMLWLIRHSGSDRLPARCCGAGQFRCGGHACPGCSSRR